MVYCAMSARNPHHARCRAYALTAEAQSPAIDDGLRLQLLIDAVTDYAIYMLDPEGRRQLEPGAQQLKGYAADEIIGQHFSQFFTPEDRAAGLPANAPREAEGRASRPKGWRVRKDGSRFWANAVVEPIRDGQGRADRLCQGHPRHHRTRGGRRRRCARASAASACSSKASSTTPSTCSIRRRDHQLERRRRAHEGLSAGRDHRPAFLALLHARRTAPPACRPACSRPRGARAASRPKGWRVRKDGSRFWASVVHRRDPRRRAASSSASPRSPATSPSAAPPRRRCARASASSACSCAASPTTRSTCSTRTAS